MLTRGVTPAGGSALAILDAVLDVTRSELLSRHPLVGDLVEAADPYDPLDVVARLLVGRLDELRDIADAYRRALRNNEDDAIF